MKNKGMTLIELMIVVAVMGISFHMFEDRYYLELFKRQEMDLSDQERLFSFRNRVAALLKESRYAIKAVDRQVIFDNFRIVVSKDKSKLYLNKKLYEFKNIKIDSFEMVSQQAVKLKVKNNLNLYEIFWVAQAYEPEEIDSEKEKKGSKEPFNIEVKGNE